MNIDVFISHSSKDANIAKAICNTLESNGIRVWIAPRDIMPGSDWAESINNAIESSKAMVLVFSEYSNDSVQVAKELNLAVNNKLIILPFKIDETAPTGSMKYYLSDTHWLDAINGDMKDEIEKLKDVLISFLPSKPNIFSNKPIESADATHSSKETLIEERRTNISEFGTGEITEEILIANTSSEEDEKTRSAFDETNQQAKIDVIPYEEVSDKAEFSDKEENQKRNKKFKSIGIWIAVIAIVLTCLSAIALIVNDKNNQSEVVVLNNIIALIEIKDENDAVILDNNSIVSFEKHYDEELGYYILLGLSSDGQTKFSNYTSANVGKQSKIYINKELILAPMVTEELNTTEIIISGDYSEEQIDEIIENLHTEYNADEKQASATEEPVEDKNVENQKNSTSAKTTSENITTQQKCNICGSTSHTKHPTCSVCGSTSHTSHPTCAICGSTSHVNHPTCPVCGSTSHTSHPTCPVCGSTSHTSHPQENQQATSCPVCGSKYHSEHPTSDAPSINKDFD